LSLVDVLILSTVDDAVVGGLVFVVDFSATVSDCSIFDSKFTFVFSARKMVDFVVVVSFNSWCEEAAMLEEILEDLERKGA